MTCNRENVYAYFYGEWQPTTEFSEQLQVCAHCKETLAFLKKMSEEMQAIETVNLQKQQQDLKTILLRESKKVSRKTHGKKWLVAAVLLVCFGITSLTNNWNKKSIDESIYSWDTHANLKKLRSKIKRLSYRNRIKRYKKSYSKIKFKISELKQKVNHNF